MSVMAFLVPVVVSVVVVQSIESRVGSAMAALAGVAAAGLAALGSASIAKYLAFRLARTGTDQ
ncbi:MAG: hypothetical protein EHM42_15655 [Planctomycetaceae bacterium]|nr:MAG: hypothetical protein EHM42_15655 [Planctomycetaceae bacterium]